MGSQQAVKPFRKERHLIQRENYRCSDLSQDCFWMDVHENLVCLDFGVGIWVRLYLSYFVGALESLSSSSIFLFNGLFLLYGSLLYYLYIIFSSYLLLDPYPLKPDFIYSLFLYQLSASPFVLMFLAIFVWICLFFHFLFLYLFSFFIPLLATLPTCFYF